MFGPSGRMPSASSHNFSMVPKAEIQRSSFNRNHRIKTTFDAGNLVPVYIDEVLPGDTFNLNMSTFARLATPLTPIMDNLYLDSFFFFVPNRLIWDNWQKFNGEQRNPSDSTDFEIPQITMPAITGATLHSLDDYFGIPTGVASLSVASLWHRAYNLIWNEWFRDQNLQNSVVVDTDNGPDSIADYVLLKRGKRHDYFTSCLPWPQKGDAVTIPLGTDAPIAYDQAISASNHFGVWSTVAEEYTKINTLSAGVDVASPSGNSATEGNRLYADLSQATAATINALRLAFQVQRLYERDARGGTRYTEIIRSHFGVISPDARLQRPEYLGGGSTPINIYPIAQTSESATTPQATLTAIGVISASNHGFVKSFTEHGVLIGMVNVRADLSYQQGLNRMFSRSTRFDFYWPALAHIGEQSVLNKEIYTQGTAADNDVFGYQERYAEYRYKPSIITGKFRSTASGSLDIWHLAQEFGSLPALNSTFITEDPPVDRVIAVANEPHILFDAYIALNCVRPMPTYSVPGLIDHF